MRSLNWACASQKHRTASRRREKLGRACDYASTLHRSAPSGQPAAEKREPSDLCFEGHAGAAALYPWEEQSFWHTRTWHACICTCTRSVVCYGLRGVRVGEASNPGPVPTLISIVNSNGDTTPLRLSDVGSRGHWRFQAQPYLTSSRRSSGDKLSPLAALTTWYQKHGKNLHPESQTHLEQLIREHSGNAVPLQTSQQETREPSPAEEEASQWPENISQPIPSSKDVKRDMQGATLPDARQFEQLAAMSLDQMLESRVMTQRHLPKASRDMFTASCHLSY